MRADVWPTKPELFTWGNHGSPMDGELLSSYNKVLVKSLFPIYLCSPMLCSKDVALTYNKSVFHEDTNPESWPAASV